MAFRVIMPALGMAQETGLITEWLKHEGDMVKEGEPLLEIETDKTTAVLEAEASGILSRVTAFAGEDVPVTSTIAWILAPGESIPVEGLSQEAADVGAGEKVVETADVGPVGKPVVATPVAGRMAQEHSLDLALVKPGGGKVTKHDVLAYLEAQDGSEQPIPAAFQTNGTRLLPASPKARQLAADRGYELALIPGSGPEGAVVTADVLAYELKTREAAAEKIAVPASPGAGRAWLIMAQRLAESWRTVPHFYLTRDVDMTAFLEWYQVAQKRAEEKLTYTDLLIKVTATALGEHPRVNASWIEGDIRYNEAINIGLAVAVEDGLLVPVIHGADRLSLAEIATARKEIVSRAQAGKLTLRVLQGGTFTLSNLGMYVVDAFSAIVNPPEAAILAAGRITERVVPVNGKAKIRPMMTVTLSLDHRVVDGARGARFLDTLVGFIEEPLSIL